MGFLLHHSIEGSAARDPDRDAFRFDGAGLSYHELVRRADQIAGVLIEEGVRPGDRVGIYMHKALELPVALYGILKAGAAYVPIDPATPPARLAWIARNCEIAGLVTRADRVATIDEAFGGRMPMRALWLADSGGDLPRATSQPPCPASC